MKYLITTIVALVLVGCGNSQQSSTPAKKSSPPSTKSPPEEFYEAAQKDPRKAWKTGFKVMKKEKCISKGVTIGGDNADTYMPQFINFFKENLL